MSSDYWQVPIGDLRTIQNNLNDMSATLDGVEGDAQGAEGVDKVHGHRISQAVEEFFSEWKASRRTLIKNIEGMGTVSGEIAKAVESFDTETGSALNQFGAELRKVSGGA